MLQLPRAAGQRRADLAQAMEHLFAAGKIKVGEYGRGGRHRHIVESGQESLDV
jgi:hypothetical protein